MAHHPKRPWPWAAILIMWCVTLIGMSSTLPRGETVQDAFATRLWSSEGEIDDDEVPLQFMKTTIATPFSSIEVDDRHAVVDHDCPRYVTMMKQRNGLGHQLGTYTTALITSLFLNLTLADSPFVDQSVHGDYPGIAAFTGLQHGEHLLEDVLPIVEHVIDVRNIPITPSTDNLRALYEPLRSFIQDTHGTACNVLFRLPEYYSYDYGSFTKRIVAQKFRDAPERRPLALVYDADQFIIAVHIREGDINPTAEAFFVSVLRQIIPQMVDTPYSVHVFVEGRGEQDYPGIAGVVPRDKLRFHPTLSPFESFYHLTQAHVLVMSASGFSQFAAILATKPLVFSPPSRESFPLKFCPPYAVCCGGDGTFGLDGSLRLLRRKERWRWRRFQL